MKVHKYVKRFFDQFSYEEKRLYISGHGVIRYFGDKAISFYNSEDIINESHEIIIRNLPNYRGEIELPDDEVLRLIALGKTFNHAEKEFKKTAKSLINKINF